MKIPRTYLALLTMGLLILFVSDVQAQFTAQWLDVGELHMTYSESGARCEGCSSPAGMEFPAIMRESSHARSRAVWIGAKNWTDPQGRSYPFYVARVGPRDAGLSYTFPVQNRLISKTEDTEVEVDGALSFDNVAIVDEIDPNLPADRMVHTIHNMTIGVTVDRKSYAFINEHHDNYNISVITYTNTGNVDDDEEIELQGQTLDDAYFYRIYRWRGNSQATRVTTSAQLWGKFSMIDIVGDGHAEYPVDFSAAYLWMGYDPDFTRYNNLGGPIWDDSHWAVMDGDSVGRLAGGDWDFVATLHADNSTTDNTYIKCTPETFDTCQPHTMGWIDSDEALNADGAPHQAYYEDAILTRENPDKVPGGSSRMFPHYADRIEPSGEFWNPTSNASTGKQGGHAYTQAYGPYDMEFGESVTIVIAEGVAGLSIPAKIAVGRPYKRSGGDDNLIIEFDSNGDGVIDTTPFGGGDYHNIVNSGSEAMTKNQWVMTARDSVFKTIQNAINVWDASNGMQSYAVPQPPLAPTRFVVTGRPNQIELSWTPASGGSTVTGWEVWRSSRFEDNIYDTQLIAELGAGTTSYNDESVIRGTDYYYYVQAVGESQSVDPTGLNGTPDGAPLKSSRYLTQTYLPVNLKRPPGRTIDDARIVPNPLNLGSDPGVGIEGRSGIDQFKLFFFDIPGQSRIRIYTELGEFVRQINHTDGSGDEVWNLTTESRQPLVSGIYIALIENLETGESTTQKFVVIR